MQNEYRQEHTFSTHTMNLNGVKHRVSVTTDAEELTDVVEAFEDYLRSAGFCFDGHLEIIPVE